MRTYVLYLEVSILGISQYLCLDQKSFYATVECVERGLDPMTTNLVVADPERSVNTICLAVSPSLKAQGIRNRSSSRTLYRSRRLFFEKSSLTHAVAPPLRKKSRLLRLFACKRAHDASAALPTFCGCAPAARAFKSLYEMPKKSFLLRLDKNRQALLEACRFLLFHCLQC